MPLPKKACLCYWLIDPRTGMSLINSVNVLFMWGLHLFQETVQLGFQDLYHTNLQETVMFSAPKKACGVKITSANRWTQWICQRFQARYGVNRSWVCWNKHHYVQGWQVGCVYYSLCGRTAGSEQTNRYTVVLLSECDVETVMFIPYSWAASFSVFDSICSFRCSVTDHPFELVWRSMLHPRLCYIETILPEATSLVDRPYACQII